MSGCEVVMSTYLPRSSPPRLGPQWSGWIVIVAVLFLLAVFAFYYYTS
jgi:hypothetical protein